MIERRIDGLARAVAEPMPRRRLLALLGLAVLGAAAPSRALAQVGAAGGGCPQDEQRCGSRCCGRHQTCVGVGAAARCSCANPELPDRCGKECGDLRFGYGGCGRCGRACPFGSECRGGRCVPAAPECGGVSCHSSVPGGGEGTLPLAANAWCCGGACVDIRREEANCGACGRTCPAGQTCCRGVCRNTRRDPAACGGCFERCPAERPICHAAVCRETCPKPLRRCGRTCANPNSQVCCDGNPIDRDELQVSDAHCGGCKPCPPGTTCRAGACGPICAEGQGFCSGRCVDTSSDPANCGPDCTECGYNDPECCAGRCTNIALNEEHCGACFNRCKPGEYCRFGVCTCPLGQVCG